VGRVGERECEGQCVPACSAGRAVDPVSLCPRQSHCWGDPAAVEPCGQQKVTGRAQSAGGSAQRLFLSCLLPCREKLVKVTVELLSAEVAEKAVVVVTLRLVAVLMAKHDWRVPFATEGGVRAVLACMQQHAASALVQQAGLAVSVAE